MSVYVAPYSLFSESAKLLSKEMRVKRIRKNGSVYRDRPNNVVINWGNSGRNFINTINTIEGISNVTDKLKFFRTFNGLFRHPDWTDNRATAESWRDLGFKIVERHAINSFEGRGIRIVDKGGDVREAPLYTKYIPKQAEYRVHIVNNSVILVQRKILKKGIENPNFNVRNSANGFIFQRNNINIPDDVTVQALKAMKAANLDFGAVDVIWNEHRKKAFVLEINTAPGIEGTTIKDYAKALTDLIKVRFPNL